MASGRYLYTLPMVHGGFSAPALAVNLYIILNPVRISASGVGAVIASTGTISELLCLSSVSNALEVSAETLRLAALPKWRHVRKAKHFKEKFLTISCTVLIKLIRFCREKPCASVRLLCGWLLPRRGCAVPSKFLTRHRRSTPQLSGTICEHRSFALWAESGSLM